MPGPLVCDIASTELTDHEVARIRSPLVGMVILFTRNYKNPAQLKKLCDSIHAVKPDVLIGVDRRGPRAALPRGLYRNPEHAHLWGTLESGPRSRRPQPHRSGLRDGKRTQSLRRGLYVCAGFGP